MDGTDVNDNREQELATTEEVIADLLKRLTKMEQEVADRLPQLPPTGRWPEAKKGESAKLKEHVRTAIEHAMSFRRWFIRIDWVENGQVISQEPYRQEWHRGDFQKSVEAERKWINDEVAKIDRRLAEEAAAQAQGKG